MTMKPSLGAAVQRAKEPVKRKREKLYNSKSTHAFPVPFSAWRALLRDRGEAQKRICGAKLGLWEASARRRASGACLPRFRQSIR